MKDKNKIIKINLSILIAFIFLFAVPSSTFAYQEVQYIDAIVLLEPGIDLEIPGVEYKYRWDAINGFAGRMSYTTYNRLEQSRFVKSIEIDSKSIALAEDILDWGVDDIDAERIWGGEEDALDIGSGNTAGEGINVMIADSGIDYNHVDLNDNYVWGYDWYDQDNDPMDEYGHGTFVAGIIAAEDNELGVIGVAPKASLYAARVSAGGTETGVLSALLDAIYWATFPNERTVGQGEPRMDVISMSIALNDYSSALETMCQLAYNNGIVLIAAVGNKHPSQFKEIGYPAKYSSVIAVGAIDSNHIYQTFSRYGPELDFVAPGVNIYSTKPNDAYGYDTGTSFATPLVSGLAVMILSEDPSLSPADVKNIIQSNAISLGSPVPNQYYGYGLVNTFTAFDDILDIVDNTDPIVDITSPSPGLVHDTIIIRASATDNRIVTKVQSKIEPGGVWTDDTAEPYEWTLDTTQYANGVELTITVKAWDAQNNYDIDQITVTVLNGGGGGGCPILSVYDGAEYIEEGLLDIHNLDGIDVVTIHTLVTTPEAVNHRYLLRLTEYYTTISHIDKVQLYGLLPDGTLVPLHLISAFHSTLGQVRWTLWFNDDNRVKVLGADHNEGNSEFIDLEFVSSADLNFIELIFIIEGHNRLVK